MATFNWKDSLEESRKSKTRELSDKCNQAILGRFSAPFNGLTYQFSNDMEAQINFEKISNAFSKGLTTQEPWTAYDDGGKVVRLLLNEESFNIVYTEHLSHIRDNISKFRDSLMPLVDAATTVEEVNQVEWDATP
jgi:hypothetical protein